MLEGRVAEARRKLAAAERELAAWQAGAEGERRTGSVLSALPTDSWIVLHDLPSPGRPFVTKTSRPTQPSHT